MAEYTVSVNIDNGQIAAIVSAPVCQEKLTQVSEVVLAMQKRLCPVDTSRLVNSLEIRKTEDGLGREIGSFTVDYALPVETGHHVHNSNTWVPAQPYIRPSIDAAKRFIEKG